jgi:NAD(P)-dependent dehydrogenase (short-subunit alcohol dehydrogenase family)
VGTLFAGKSVLVTGGGSGIGRATALAFAREGAAVVVAGRHKEALDHTVKLITGEGGNASAVTADVTLAGDVPQLIEAVVGRHGGLDIAFNNAGMSVPGLTADLTEDDWQQIIAVNLTGTWRTMKHEIGHMRANGGGVIVNMASTLGTHRTVPGMGAYAATKAGIAALTRAAAREYIADGIRINIISPGAVNTPASFRPGESEADRDQRIAASVPIGRTGTVEEIAAGVLWLASADSSFAVGQDLVLDGGSTA